MRKTRTLLTFALTLLIVFGATSASFASRAEDLLEKARQTATSAENTRDREDRRDKFDRAIKDYAKLTSDKKLYGTPQVAEALYESAGVQITLAEKRNNAASKEQHNHLYQAYETLKQLINLYDKPRDVLGSSYNLDDSEIARVQRVSAGAKTLQTSVAERINKLNSQDPKYKFIDFFVRLTGKNRAFSYWFAIILITLLVKIVLTPLTKAQFKSMKEMQKIGPLVKEIQEKYKGDQKAIGEKTMELYKQHNVNPFASCLPLLIQMPILMMLYYSIRSYEFEFAKGAFLWIGSGFSHAASLPVVFNPAQLVWVTARNLAEPDLILLLLYVVSMYFSTKLSSVDPTQAEQQKMMAIVMPVMFGFLFAGFQSAFMLYWLVFNILQTGQQYLIMHTGPNAQAAAVQTPTPPPAEPSDSQRVYRRKRRK